MKVKIAKGHNLQAGSNWDIEGTNTIFLLQSNAVSLSWKK